MKVIIRDLRGHLLRTVTFVVVVFLQLCSNTSCWINLNGLTADNCKIIQTYSIFEFYQLLDYLW